VTPEAKKVALAIEVDATSMRPAWQANSGTGQVQGLGQFFGCSQEQLVYILGDRYMEVTTTSNWKDLDGLGEKVGTEN
jgi:hypothetical protein